MKECRSFYNMGFTGECFNCAYCMLKNTNFNNTALPPDRYMPVSVNLFYGDPMLQIDNTVRMLRKLSEHEHKGVVFMATKGDYSIFNYDFDLDLHVAFSTFGIDSPLDGGSMRQFKYNLEHKNDKYTHSIEYRPIISGVNDDATEVMELAEKYNLPVAYGGLTERGKEVPEITENLIKSFPVKTYRKTLDLLKER